MQVKRTTKKINVVSVTETKWAKEVAKEAAPTAEAPSRIGEVRCSAVAEAEADAPSRIGEMRCSAVAEAEADADAAEKGSPARIRERKAEAHAAEKGSPSRIREMSKAERQDQR